MTAKEELLMKLKALAERGESGERENAERMLASLMDKYGITEEQLDAEKPDFHWYAYSNIYEKRLANQVFFKVTGDGHNSYVSKAFKGRQGCLCTVAQSIEIEALYGFYRRKLKEDMELLYVAFIQCNEVFPMVCDENTNVKRYDRDYSLKVMAMAGTLERHEYMKQIAED